MKRMLARKSGPVRPVDQLIMILMRTEASEVKKIARELLNKPKAEKPFSAGEKTANTGRGATLYRRRFDTLPAVYTTE